MESRLDLEYLQSKAGKQAVVGYSCGRDCGVVRVLNISYIRKISTFAVRAAVKELPEDDS